MTGVEPDEERVRRADIPRLLHVPDMRHLPFEANRFDFVLCNAVLEHIPQSRAEYIREIWRVLRRGGLLMVCETPNKYLRIDFHTARGLPLINWLPRGVAHWIAVRTNRFRADRADWASSGWRGLGHYELLAPLTSYRLKQPVTRPRHKFFRALGLPPQLLDPYPVWILQKL